MPSPSAGSAFAGRTFDAVLFDMDGTLISSIAAVERAWVTWATEEGVPLEKLLTLHGKPAIESLRSMVAPERVGPSLERIVWLEENDIDGIVLLPGAVAALESIPDSMRAIVTSCTRNLAAIRIEASRLPAPSVVVTYDDVTHGKPHPEPFLLGASRLGVDPSRTLVVEDAPGGLEAAKAAGMATLGVLGTHKAEELDADAVAVDLSHVRFEMTDEGLVVRDV